MTPELKESRVRSRERGVAGTLPSAGAGLHSNPAARFLERLRFPASSKVFDRIFRASTTGPVGPLPFPSIRRIERGDWLGSVRVARSLSRISESYIVLGLEPQSIDLDPCSNYLHDSPSRCFAIEITSKRIELIVLVLILPKEVSKWFQAYRNGIATSIAVLLNVRSIENLRQG
ncbi:hypothetical protein PGT21_030612 [Puccinia graminis f. sp. tritici]|uniref:Uncharacterized protein n=1 Tax=Puccinia graminis f. sp. tritici TaxID=56615 RepID=A0A5B0QUH2_PUCGR|nr:hypothetical protein PGT21_030612 [Puccinia graminis f. sp. tritici]KAA1116830.1 hypothetical protein PGTUg99_024117 [Puccinia graminis f. sp. tritici]